MSQPRMRRGVTTRGAQPAGHGLEESVTGVVVDLAEGLGTNVVSRLALFEPRISPQLLARNVLGRPRLSWRDLHAQTAQQRQLLSQVCEKAGTLLRPAGISGWRQRSLHKKLDLERSYAASAHCGFSVVAHGHVTLLCRPPGDHAAEETNH